MEVELRAFRGLPNPRWLLADSEEEAFLALLNSLPPGDLGVSTCPTIGPRGILVTDLDDAEVIVYHESVVVRRQGKEVTLVDVGRNVENWLLGTAPGQMRERVRLLAADDR